MPNKIRTEKEATLQEMLDNYNEISRIGVIEFSDYYDCRLDGIDEKDLKQPSELDEYVNKLLAFQKEEDAGLLEEEEEEVFNDLKKRLQSEVNETGIHKLLQFKLMTELLNTDGNLESEHLQKAAECQKLYDDITASFEIIRADAEKNAMQDDGSFNKSPKKIAEEIFAKEETKEKKPLMQICTGMLHDFEKYRDILAAPALMPYQTFLDEKIKEKERNEKKDAVENAMTPEEKEKRRLNQEIAERRAKKEELTKQLNKTNELFNEEYQKAKKKGIVLTVPNKKKPGSRVFMKTSKISDMQKQEKAELNEIFHAATDEFVRCVDAIKATDKGQSSDEFRKMIESLTMLRNQKDTLKNLGEDTKSRNLTLVDTIAKVYEYTNEYIMKREKDSFFSRHLGQGGTRYKQAKAVRDLLETYHEAAEQLDLNRLKDVFLMRLEKKDALREEIGKIENEIDELTELRDGKKKRENLERSGDEQQKSVSTRQRLENGFQELNDSAESEKKQISEEKQTSEKQKAVNRKKSQSAKTVASEKSIPEMKAKGKKNL